MIDLYNDNCLNILKNIPNESVDLIATDPPYKTTPYGQCSSSGGMFTKKVVMQGKVFEHNNINCEEYAFEFYRVLKDGGHCYVMCNHKNLIEFLNTFTASGFCFVKSLIWDKKRKINGRFYMSQFEYILFFRKGKGVQINHCGTGDILSIANKKLKTKNGENLHDTQKPVELMEILINNSSNKNEIVLDPFMGIGTTGIAALNLGRNFIGVELDEKYFNIAKERIENFENATK